MTFWYTINGISGTPRQEIAGFVAAYFEKKGKQVQTISDPKGSIYGELANKIIVDYKVVVSAFTEALLYLTCSKEVFDKVDWENYVVSRGSFLETFGYRNQLSDWILEDAKQIFFLFIKHINNNYPILSIVLTENYATAAQRAGEHFEYQGEKEKYIEDSNRFLRIKEHPIVQEVGMKLINVEFNSRDPWQVFKKEIEPMLNNSD
ncbi:hypothetical protein [Candidatus Cardinium hertigii]|jgi:thymidylate kinase|uniref:Thymidylate kinase-like domain-containing protein n=1 Tax=Candidatus Cardinium hertigii TaxID=247481 RepID=A0A3N2QAU2_9BACT|nr:hypothetical protein [Candidatus Cardinium hertigii]ROT46914.1 hypothetical protein EDM02_05040 [Candidatus Cardinium hertigii]